LLIFDNPRDRWQYYLAFGRRHLWEDLAEDFAQECYVRFLKAGSEINLKYVLTDFLRSLYGRTGARRNLTLCRPLNNRVEYLASQGWEPIDWPVLEGREAEVWDLLLAGVSQSDIAKSYGVTRARISHIIARIRQKIAS
jgi:hypothetical protein